MADPQKALEILRRYYATVTPEKFLEDVKHALPEGVSRYDDWVFSKNAMKLGVDGGTSDVVTNSAILGTK